MTPDSRCSISLLLTVWLVAFGGPASADDSLEFIHRTPDPATYVLSKLENHRVVLFGESHWVANEVELITSIVPRLPAVGVRTLAVEVFPAVMQKQLDEVVAGKEWDKAGAVAVLREAEMPHVEYLEIIEAVWSVNWKKGPGTLTLVAMGPGPDWRDTLPRGEELEKLWTEQAESRTRPILESRWKSVDNWREKCETGDQEKEPTQ